MIKKTCNRCYIKKTADHFYTRNRGKYLVPNCKQCYTEIRNETRPTSAQIQRKTGQTIKKGRPQTAAATARINTVIGFFKNNATHLTRAEIAEKTGINKSQLQFILFNPRTKHLFSSDGHKIAKYHLSAPGHCATEQNNFFIDQEKPVQKKDQANNLHLFFLKHTVARCSVLAC